MTNIDKVIQKFLDNPSSIRYADMHHILIHYNFEFIQAKGSHTKYKHPRLENDLIIPVHNNDRKDFYKKEAKKCVVLIKEK